MIWIAVFSIATPLAAQPDLVGVDITSVTTLGSVSGISAFSCGVTLCNQGSAAVAVDSATNNHPLIGLQLYRLEGGRLEQIGMSWLFHTFCALGGGACGACAPSPCSVLGVSCSDTHSSAILGQQGGLGPRSEINASTGDYVFPFTGTGATGDPIFKRLQVANSDLDPVLHPGALYFAEVLFMSPDEYGFGTELNNAIQRQVIVSPPTPAGGTQLAVTGPTFQGTILELWQQFDATVDVVTVDVAGDGRLQLASRVASLGSNFRYDYALLNMTSDRGVGAFAVPTNGAVVSNLSFHDVDYHSGEPYDSSDWSEQLSANSTSWVGGNFGSDPNGNALRWGTTYSFGFNSVEPPTLQEVEAVLFAPGTPDSVTFLASAPEGTPVPVFFRGDANNDGAFSGLLDGLFILNYQFVSGPTPSCLEAADADANGILSGLLDALYLLNFQFGNGPPPPAPGVTCGTATDYPLGCLDSACI